MPTLYHHPLSTASRFIRLILSEYGFQADLVEEQVWEKRREFLNLNPAGTLPVYVDDNMRTLCGATVISEFLGLLAMLVFLSINGHLMLLAVIGNSFEWWPVGADLFPANGWLAIARWGSTVFSAGLPVGLAEGSAQAERVRALLHFMTSPDAEEAKRRQGMEPA